MVDYQKKPSILFVEDNTAYRNMIAATLKQLNYPIETDDGRGGLERVMKKIDRFKPQILLTDFRLPGFSGNDIIEKTKKQMSFNKILISQFGERELGKKAKENGAYGCLSKGFSPKQLFRILSECQDDLAQKKKKYLLGKLLKAADHAPLPLLWQNINEVKSHKSGSHILYADLNEKFTSVRIIGLYLKHLFPHHGSCISISYGCEKSCPICGSGTEEEFKGHYGYDLIVAMQELVFRECDIYYDNDFWLYDQQFFIAFMGQGEVALNFKNTIRAAEIHRDIFGDRFVCNISTAFIAGVKKLIRYVTTNGMHSGLIPNLQISIHGPNRKIRRSHVDSDEDPKKLVLAGLEYAKISGTKLTVNYGLTGKNMDLAMVKEVLGWLEPKISRIKYSQMQLPRKSKLSPAPRSSFSKLAAYTRKRGIEYEIFNEKRQMGFEIGAACGTVVNRII